MPMFRILYLRQSKLERAETLDGLDLLEAIDRASDSVGPETAEIWSDQGKVGVVAPIPRRQFEEPEGPERPESQISNIMKARLSVTP